ncbi:MAG TPA: fibronectin type III domain-containing protein [Ignavibacteria bacterium]|mgnify:CR=1 FL=1|nr:hypothetical protein [Bacteroidota bacterium]HRE11460.1 fibronectin type III domain-containing protein [Ignavibacteria bacterium]HRF65612.1 fibronectin type III domain-containing protein [Ignavibacteria bacterium]HRJ03356.1 fibronectin type III domain-containing protein [Ignavibacteria bacterium]
MRQIRTGKNETLKKNRITLHAAPGLNSGEIELLWQPLENSPSYIIQVNLFTRSDRTWKHADIVSRTRYTAAGLKSGKKYSFRVAPVTQGGQQEWSMPVIEKAS